MKERIQSTEEKNTMLTDLNMVHSMISLHEKTNKLKSGDGQEPLVLSHSFLTLKVQFLNPYAITLPAYFC